MSSEKHMTYGCSTYPSMSLEVEPGLGDGVSFVIFEGEDDRAALILDKDNVKVLIGQLQALIAEASI